MAQHFDVAVIGMQLSGIITAALLAKRGRRVLLVDHGENTTTYRRKGLSLPLLPSLLPSLEQAPHVQRVHDELGIGPELRAMSHPLDPAFQAIMPRHRLDIRGNREMLLHELGLEFPDMLQPLQVFFTRLFELDQELTTFLTDAPPLPPSGWMERLATRSALSKMAPFNAPFESDALLAGIPPDHPLRELLLGPLTFFGHLWSDTPSTFHAVRLIARYFRGVAAVEDGAGGLGRLLLQAAERAGVTVRRGAVVRSLTSAGRRLKELVIEDDRLNHGAEFFVANTVGHFHDLVPADSRQARFVAEEQSVTASGSLLVVNLVVHRAVIPCGMASALFLLNGRRQSRDSEAQDPPLFLQRFAAHRGEDSTVRGNLPFNDVEHEVLSVACPVRHEVALTPGRLSALKTQMLARVRRIVPFLDGYLDDVSMPIDTTHWDADTDGVGRRVDPWRLHPIFETGSRPVLGIAMRPSRTYYKNLVHCGRDVVPGLGLEGEYMTGANAAAILQKMGGRRWRA